MKKLLNHAKLLAVAVLFVSGTAAAQTELSNIRQAGAENKVAVLPLTYIGEGSETRQEEMRYVLQNIACRFLQEKAQELKMQPTAETNALLLKSGVTTESLRKFTPKELAALLGVEYVITGSVNQQVEGVITNRNTARTSEEKDHHGNKRTDDVRYSTQTRSSQDLNTTIDIAIYNDKGEEIFSRSKRSILSDADAYKNALHYVLKRSPLYNR